MQGGWLIENENKNDSLEKSFIRNFFQDPNLLPSQILNSIYTLKFQSALQEAKLAVSEFFLGYKWGHLDFECFIRITSGRACFQTQVSFPFFTIPFTHPSI